ncbi:MAG: prolipoprotein diacylglyceryl transferase [Dehalococcoidia bacterium]
MIEIGIDPILFNIGPFALGWHGVFVILAVIVGIAVSLGLARGDGIDRSIIYGIAPWAILGGIVGARLFHVLDYLAVYANDPMAMLRFWEGGLSIFGAILGGTLAGVIYARVSGLSLGHLVDLVAPGLILAQAVGRIGCILNGDAYGMPTDLPWAFVYTHPNAAATTLLGVAGHPSPVYEIIWDLLVFAVLWRLRGRIRPEGSLFLVYLSLYAFGRFFIEFTRALPQAQYQINVGVLHEAHIIALLVLAVCVPLLISRMRRPGASAQPSVAGED